MGRARPGFAAAVAVILSTGTARGHGLSGTRFDAPVPAEYLLVGAGGAVAVTAAWLSLAREPGEGISHRHLASIPASVATGSQAALRAASLVVFSGIVLHGLVGNQAPATNLATTAAWSVGLEGIGLLAILVGSPWRVLSPWETLYGLLVRIEGREIAVLEHYPRQLASWPAFAGFTIVVGVIGNLTVIPSQPRATAALLVGYALVMFLGSVAFGRSWFRKADALSVLYGLFGRVAPFRFYRRDDGGYDLRLRAPWEGCRHPMDDLSMVAFVAATAYTVSYDGFTATQVFRALAAGGRELGLGPLTGVALYLAGLVVVVGAIRLVAGAGDDARGDGSSRRATRAFAPSLLPVVAAYEVAHVYPVALAGVSQSFWVAAGLAGVQLQAGDPLAGLSLPVFWASQVALVVAGHAIAVVAAHGVAVRRYGSLGAARWGCLPIVGVLVGYTAVSLWLVS